MILIKIALIILLLIIVAYIALAIYFFNFTIVRKDKPMVSKNEMGDNDKWEGYLTQIKDGQSWINQRGYEDIYITSKDGLKLHAYYTPCDKPSNKLAICIHGYTSQGFNECPSMAKMYNDLGYSALIVDNRAHGKSEGKYIGFGILDRFDLLNWIDYSLKRWGNNLNIVLHGDSMGASTVLMTSGFNELPNNVKVIVADCGFTSPARVFSHILKRDYHLSAFPLIPLTSILCKIFAGYGFDSYTTLEAMKKTKTPTIFIAGKQDTFVPTFMTQENYDACIAPKELLWIDGAGHAASFFEDNTLVVKKLTEFISKYIQE